MAVYPWQEFLSAWSRELLAAPAIRKTLPPQVADSGWLGFPGATAAQLAAAEERLGIALAPSYREFLAVTNGWRTTGPFIHRLWAAEEIAWFAARHTDWIAAYVDAGDVGSDPAIVEAAYRVYGPAQLPFRLGDLPAALEVSDVGDEAIYLLNPRVVAADGEWEAWFFANWVPGANRYRSFWELMQAQRATFRFLEERRP